MLGDVMFRLRAFFKRHTVEREIDDELRFHLDRQVESYLKNGVTRDEATRRARLEFGGFDQTQEAYRDALGVRGIDDVRRDLRLAVRSLRATPVVAVVAILSLGLGIGANTAIFSIVNSLLLRALPVRDPARLVLVTDTPARIRVWSYAFWQEIHRRAELFESSACWSFDRFNLASGGEAHFIDGLWASGSFFETLGVPVRFGRTFSEADDRRGGGPNGPVAVISDSFWQRRFGGAADVIGRTLALDGVPFTVVGVTPPGFRGPEVGRGFDVILPVADEVLIRGGDTYLDQAGTSFLTIIARLRPDQTLEGAIAALRRVHPQIREVTIGDLRQFGSPAAIDRYLKEPITLAPGAAGDSDLRSQYERPLLTLMVIVALLLLIACVNVANLLVARAVARRHEMSLRLALGASRWQLARQLLSESAVLSVAGAAVGVAIAYWSSRLLVQQLSTSTNTVVLDLSMDGRVLAFTAAITILTALVFGTAPAWRAARAAPIEALKEHGRTGAQTRGAVAGWFLVAQVAASVVLVVAAGLFIRTFTSLTGRPLGFQPDQVLVVTMDAQRTTVDLAQRLQLWARVREAVRALPDVADAAVSLTTPLANEFTPSMEIDGVAPSDTPREVYGNLISPGWFTTFGTPVIAGRDFSDRDRQGAARVAVVNDTFARTLLKGGDPIGRTITIYPHSAMALTRIDIVGVVADAIYSSLRDPVPPTFYVPLAQFDVPSFASDLASARLSVRSKSGSPMLLTRSVAAAAAEVDPQLALTFRLLADRVKAALTQEQLIAALAAIFAALALLLAGLGLYGVTAYGVASRRTEIGIRMALGGSPASVVWLALSRVMMLVIVGLVIGVAASAWTSHLVAALLYGLQPGDPRTLMGATAGLAVVAAIAAWLPARRAAQVDPAVILRES